MTAGEPVIAARGLTKTYSNGPAEVLALRDVDCPSSKDLEQAA